MDRCNFDSNVCEADRPTASCYDLLLSFTPIASPPLSSVGSVIQGGFFGSSWVVQATQPRRWRLISSREKGATTSKNRSTVTLQCLDRSLLLLKRCPIARYIHQGKLENAGQISSPGQYGNDISIRTLSGVMKWFPVRTWPPPSPPLKFPVSDQMDCIQTIPCTPPEPTGSNEKLGPGITKEHLTNTFHTPGAPWGPCCCSTRTWPPSGHRD